MRRYAIVIPITILCISFFIWRKKPTRLPIAETTHQTVSKNQSGYFDSLTKECSLESLPIEGNIPSWLSGDFYFTGPALFELGNTQMKYWFNGFGMIHRFSISGKKASYANAFCRGQFYNRCIKQNAIDPSMTTTFKKPSFFSGLSNAFATPKPYDNANVNIIELGNELCAVTETPYPVMFDPATLQSKGHFDFKDSLQGHLTTAQPLYDKQTKQWYNIMTELGKTSYYQVYTFDEKTNKRHCICKIPTKNPSYIRSFGLTDNSIVLIETPCIIKSMDLAFGTSFLDALSWKPKYGVTISVIDKHTGLLKKKVKTKPFFMFNIINSYENNNHLVIDCITYNNPNIINKTEVNYLRSNNIANEQSFYTRLNLDLDSGMLTSSQPCNDLIELPSINPSYLGSDYHYCYAIAADNFQTFPGTIVKVEVNSGKVTKWSIPNGYASKPIFIANPQGTQEDDGILATIVYDSSTHTSSLLFLDAQSMTKKTEIKLPHHIPFGINGIFKKGKRG